MSKVYIKNISLLLLCAAVSFASYSQTITTVAGDGGQGFNGDGGSATAAELYYPYAVAVDASGNIYIADRQNSRVRKVNTSGTISTLAGNGNTGFGGDGGPATNAELYNPTGVAVDGSGNVYIADENNNRIRKVNPSGTISTYAGSSTYGFSGDGGQATDAELNDPFTVAVDASGLVYIGDDANDRIRKINASGVINTIAGNGSLGHTGDGGPATDAELFYANGISIDAAGNIYVADFDNYRVRKINTSGIISTYAGNGALGFYGDGGPAIDAEIQNPNGVVVDVSGNVYIADGFNERIRKVNASGTMSTSAGISTPGASGDGGPASAAELNTPYGVAVDLSGNVYIADTYNNRIRKISVITGINEIYNISNEITIYPIPTTGFFTISGISQGQTIELYNYTGQKILSAISYQPRPNGSAGRASANLDISNYANGIYLVRILNKDGSVVATKKIVKTE